MYQTSQQKRTVSRVYKFPKLDVQVKSKDQVNLGRKFLSLLNIVFSVCIEVGLVVTLGVIHAFRNVIGALWLFVSIWFYCTGYHNGYVFLAGFLVAVGAHFTADISHYLVTNRIFFHIFGLKVMDYFCGEESF